MSSFVTDFMTATVESEAPRNFFYWSALAGISAVVKRQVWVNRYLYKTYPNIYVMLVAKSGLRKGVAINLVRDLVAEVDCTRVISGRSSLQGIIKDLATVTTKPNGIVLREACGFIISSEFASSFVQDPQALTILTDLYDSIYHKEWRNTLKGTGVDVLKEPCITMLAASNEAHFTEFVSPSDIIGGFVGRTMIISENKKFGINPLTRPPKNQYHRERLVKKLRDISNIKGEMNLTEGARDVFEEFYNEFADIDHNDKTGTSERIPDHIMKTATLLALAEVTTDIRTEHMEEAIERCLTSMASVNKTTVGRGKAQFAPQTRIVLQALITAPNYEIGRMQLLQRNYGDIDAFDLDRVVESLMQAGAVEQEKRGREIYYRMTHKAAKQFESFIGARQ